MEGTTPRTRDEQQHGAISVMAAVLAVAALLATSVAVDVGRVAYTSRDQQGVTDRAVHDALRRLATTDSDGDGTPDVGDGATLPELYDIVRASVDDTLDGNTEGSSVGTANDRSWDIIEIGYFDPSDPTCLHEPEDPQLRDLEGFCVMYGQDGAGSHFGSYDPSPDAGTSVTTLRVATSSTVDYVFGFIGGGDSARDVVKQAFGTNRRTSDTCPPPPTTVPCLVDAEAGISVRSRLVELDTGNSVLDDSRLEIVQQLLGSLIGHSGPTTVTAVGFDGLANTTVPLGVFGDAGATTGTTEQLLDSHVTLTDLFSAMASGFSASDPGVEGAAHTALGALSAEADPAWDIRIGDLLATTTEDPTALLTAEVNTLDLVMQAAMHAELANGDHLAELAVDASTLGGDVLDLGGLLDLSVDLTVIEGPQMAYGPVRYDPGTGRYETLAQTAQVQLDVALGMDTDAVEDLLGETLTGLVEDLLCLVPLLCPSTQDLSLSLSAARAEAELADIECVDPTDQSDLTTIVTSDAVTATVDGDDEVLFDSRDPGSGTVVIPEVPGEGSTSVADTTLTNESQLDEMLTPVLDLLGVDTGTAYVSSYAIDCDVPVLLPDVVAPSS